MHNSPLPSLSCGYVLRGSEFYICAYYVLDTETSQPLTTIHRHFHTPTSLRPRHFDSHSHFSSPFLVLETQKLEPSRTKKTTPRKSMFKKQVKNYFWLYTKNQKMTVGWKLCPHLSPPRVDATPPLAPAELPRKYWDDSAVLGDKFFLFVRCIFWGKWVNNNCHNLCGVIATIN